MKRYSLSTLTAVLRYFFGSIGWDLLLDDGGYVVTDNRGYKWRLTCGAMEQ